MGDAPSATVSGHADFLTRRRSDVHDPAVRTKQIHRLIAKMPTIAALAYKHSMGMPYVYPFQRARNYTANFLTMLFKDNGREGWSQTRRLVRALDAALHPPRGPQAELRRRRDAGRRLGAHADPYSSGGGCGGGPLRPAPWRRERGRSFKMLEKKERTDDVPAFLQKRSRKAKAEEAPWASATASTRTSIRAPEIIKRIGRGGLRGHRDANPLLDIALELDAHRAAGRVLRQAQALPERQLLLRPDLRGDPLRAACPAAGFRDPADPRLARPVGGAVREIPRRRSRGPAGWYLSRGRTGVRGELENP